MKLFFCYEANSRGCGPVLYHGNPPSKSINGAGPKVVGDVHELPYDEAKELLDTESFPTWLLEKYPPPKEASA